MATETVQIASVEISSESVTPPLPPAHRPERLRALELLLVMSVAFAPLIVNSAFAFWAGTSNNSYMRFLTATLILHECTALAVFFYVLSRQRRSLRDIGLRFKWTDLGIGALLAVGALFASSWSYVALYAWEQITGKIAQPGYSDATALQQFSVVTILLVLVNPFFEELLARGYLTSELKLLTRSRWVPLVASVLLQSSYHLYQGIPNVLAVTGCFLVWAVYFGQTGRLGPVILAHLYLDALALLRSA